MYIIDGKVAVVTGGAQGIGKAICVALLDAGASVNIVDINSAEGENIQKKFEVKYGSNRCIYTCCDVTKKREFENAFTATQDAFGRVDILCNNAGMINEDNWEDMVELNFSSVVRGTYLGRRVFQTQQNLHGVRGVIVNVSSNAGINPCEGIHVYSATKAGILAFTRSFKRLDQLERVRVNCVCPVSVDTPLWKKSFQWMNDDIIAKELQLGSISAEIVAKGVIKLIQDEDNAGKALHINFQGAQYV